MTMDSADPASNGQAVTFFNISKQIPKGVKRHCGMCRQHGVVAQTRNHQCTFKNCDCGKCNLVRQRRSIMSMQIRLRREQDKMFVRTSEPETAEIVPPLKMTENPTACYFCQKCKNHGILMWKKDHKKACAFANCRCGQCELIDTRRALDGHIKKGKRKDRTQEDGMEVVDTGMAGGSTGSISSPSMESSPPSVILFSDDFTSLSPTTTVIDNKANGVATLASLLPEAAALLPENKIEQQQQPTMQQQQLATATELLVRQIQALQALQVQQQQQQQQLQQQVQPQIITAIPGTGQIQYAIAQPTYILAAPNMSSPTTFYAIPVLPAGTQTITLAAPMATMVEQPTMPQINPIDLQNLCNNVQGLEQLLLLNRS